MILFFLFLIFSCFTYSKPLNKTTIYIDSVGEIKYLPYGCDTYCPPNKPYCGVVKCNITTSSDCGFTAYYKIESITKSNPIVGIYSVPPEKACDRESLLFNKIGYYRIYINKHGEDLIMTPQNTMEPIGDNTISIKFTLGYELN